MGGASVLCVSTTLCVSQPLVHTRAGACVSVLTEPQTHLSRCFVASTLVHATLPSPALTCSPSRAPPSPRPPFNTTVPAASELIGTVLAFAGQLGGRRARQAGDWRDGRGRGAAAGAAAWERGEGRGGRGGHQARRRFAPLPLLYCRTHYAMHPAKHYAKLHPMHCVPPSQVLPDADPDAAAQITRCLANLLLDDECRSRVVAHEGGLRLLLQQVRHRWGRRGERQWGPLP